SSYTFTTSGSSSTVTSPGTYYLWVTVKDSNGNTATSSVTITVYSDPIVSVNPTGPFNYAINQAASQLVADVTYSGENVITIKWYSNTVDSTSGGTYTGVSGATFTPSTSNLGTLYYYVVVIDSGLPGYYTYSNIIEVTVAAPPVVSIYTSPAGITAIDVKHSVLFEATVSGQIGSYSYAWTIGGSSLIVSTSDTFNFNVTVPGLYVIWLNVTQGAMKASAQPFTIFVNPLPTAAFEATLPVKVDANQTFSATVIGGTPPFTYSWMVKNYPSGTTATGDFVASDTNITFYVPGDYNVELLVKDRDGVVTIANSTFIVYPPLHASVSANGSLATVIDRGNSSYLIVSTQGGSGLFAYQWFEKGPDSNSFSPIYGANGSSFDFATSSKTMPGTYLFYVLVYDVGTDPAYVTSNIVNVTVLSELVYRITISESGLPAGTQWYVNATRGPSYTSTSSIISFLEPNGTYPILIASGNKAYKPSIGSQGFIILSVNGGNVSKSIVFTEVVYPVTFAEYGLGSGVTWFVNLTNGESFSSTSSIISFSEPNGTYSFSIQSDNKTFYFPERGGSFSVNGGSVYITVRFVGYNYSVTFEESGLPSGVKWSVSLSNGQTFNSSTNMLTFNETNGTYRYLILSGNTIYYSPGGSFVVDGDNVFVTVKFSLYYYTVTFVEEGLPSNVPWTVIFNGVTQSGSETLSFKAVNGSYAFSIVPIQGYRTEMYNGTITINGSSITEIFRWLAVTYPVQISESGLAPGAAWSATIEPESSASSQSHLTINSTSKTITFYVSNGSYLITISLPPGYGGSFKKLNISVAGTGINVGVRAYPLPNYILIYVIAAITSIVLVSLALYIRKSRKSLFVRKKEPVGQNPEKR
ncbi:MAG: hypothetical protein QW046_04380, partial [Candidatus Micrarchaeaceae archaeon]